MSDRVRGTKAIEYNDEHSLLNRAGSEPPPLRGTLFRGAWPVCRDEAIAAGVIQQLRGGFVGCRFINASANEVAQFMSVDFFAGAMLRAFAQSCRVEPGFAQMDIGNGTARRDNDTILQGQMM